jgi:N-acetylglucosamine-6-sulfatase
MSCAGHPFLKTPAIDALAGSGVRFDNAFVTTSLCSPSRATFLSGLYAHNHGIMDNSTLMDPSIPTFSQAIHAAGYRTAFVGKWHMGGASDEPRPGFDYWASFKGQGRFFGNDFNVNGHRVKVDEYVTDAITRMSLDWLRANADGPFLLYMSHKAVHGNFDPAPRHAGAYADVKIPFPASMADTPENYYRKPRWVREQRWSWHGVDDMYYKLMLPEAAIRQYSRCMLAVDESVGALVRTLKELGRYENTLIVFAGDNGFLWGEHGLIDKRCMYEESIRIPMIASCPQLYGTSGKRVSRMVLNLDVAPTFLEAAGVPIPPTMQGRSFLRLPNQPDMPWREDFLYEYFWERAYPETPTCLGVRTDRYKYVQYHGVWDADELYDLQDDPQELHNRISTSRHKQVTPDPGYEQVYRDLQARLGRLLKETGARELPSWRQ